MLYLSIAQPFYSLSLFVPSISEFVSSMEKYFILNAFCLAVAALGFTNANANLLSAAPYGLGTITTLGVAYFSDKYGVRAPFLCGAMLLTTIGYIILLCDVSNGVKFFAVFITVAGVSPSIATAITFVGNNFGPMYTRAAVMGVFFSFGNSAGIISSNVYPKSTAPHYVEGHAIALAFSVLAIALAVGLIYYNKTENARRDRVYGIPDPNGKDCNPTYAEEPERMKKWGLEGMTKMEILELGDRHPAFRYMI